MKRRKFLAASAIAASIPIVSKAKGSQSSIKNSDQKEIYELRTYNIKFRGSQAKLKDYLNNNLAPALKKNGANHYLMLSEYGMEEPPNLWVLISYPDASTFIKCQSIVSDPGFQKSASEYNAIPPTEALYSRYESSLLHAFEKMPQMDGNIDGSNLFELRIYEGYSEDAVRRKIAMFNNEEIALFLKIGLPPVFFGDMISGPYRPSLVYMLHFKDMAEREAKWKEFGAHPEWQAMRVKKEYANTVSNIRKIFLTPTS